MGVMKQKRAGQGNLQGSQRLAPIFLPPFSCQTGAASLAGKWGQKNGGITEFCD
jgi:hypothetical protein